LKSENAVDFPVESGRTKSGIHRSIIVSADFATDAESTSDFKSACKAPDVAITTARSTVRQIVVPGRLLNLIGEFISNDSMLFVMSSRIAAN
jgi:hypothetical protein